MIAKDLDVEVYFTHPTFHGNDGQMKMLTEFLESAQKKGTELKMIINEYITFAQARINHRPKKCLGFKQPDIFLKNTFTCLIERCRTSYLNSGVIILGTDIYQNNLKMQISKHFTDVMIKLPICRHCKCHQK
ncbi:hypothetical protein [Candidatus Enterovibrio escicola]|nr:hypothetical protein [Candidatus Enterovibrio escacola]